MGLGKFVLRSLGCTRSAALKIEADLLFPAGAFFQAGTLRAMTGRNQGLVA